MAKKSQQRQPCAFSVHLTSIALLLLFAGLLTYSGFTYKSQVDDSKNFIFTSLKFSSISHVDMRPISLLYGLGLTVSAWAQSGSIEAYIASESPIAKAGVLANIGPNGSKSQGAKVYSRFRDSVLREVNLNGLSLGGRGHCQSQHVRSRLPVHMDARFRPRIQGHHRRVGRPYHRP